MQLKRTLHDALVHTRRVRVLEEHLASLLPEQGRVLDIGCGDGLLARQLARRRPALDVEGIDVLARPHSHIPVTVFDGWHVPYADRSVDVVMFIDVLHHTDDPLVLLEEAKRVSRGTILIKDHLLKGILCRTTLRWMDWAGNAHHGVALPHNYWTESQWQNAFDRLDLDVEQWIARPRLYPPPADWIFGRSLHFIASLRAAESGARRGCQGAVQE